MQICHKQGLFFSTWYDRNSLRQELQRCYHSLYLIEKQMCKSRCLCGRIFTTLTNTGLQVDDFLRTYSFQPITHIGCTQFCSERASTLFCRLHDAIYSKDHERLHYLRHASLTVRSTLPWYSAVAWCLKSARYEQPWSSLAFPVQTFGWISISIPNLIIT